MVNKEQILVAFGTSDAGALGNIWRIIAQSTDFYVKALRIHKVFHLSVHGPNNRHPDGHRFHVKIDPDAANKYVADLGSSASGGICALIQGPKVARWRTCGPSSRSMRSRA